MSGGINRGVRFCYASRIRSGGRNDRRGIFCGGVGAALGAWLRWMLNIELNTVLPNLALGTLASNLIGGYLIGMAVEYFFQQGTVPLELRLFVITGFLGGLTLSRRFPPKRRNC